jgi:hypothetical protein
MRFPIGPAFFLATCALTQLPACGGGCYATQQNFLVTPAESCIQPVLDVCQAQGGWLTLQNSCSDNLTILNPLGDAGASNIGVPDASAANAFPTDVVIAPGTKVQFDASPFSKTSESGSRFVTIPAVLGATSITITYVVN